MITKLDSILLAAVNPKELADFYGEKVGLSLIREMAMGDDESPVYEFGLGENGPTFVIMSHSAVSDNNKSPERIMLNLEVDDIETDAKRLTDAGVKVIQEIYHIQDYGFVATFCDSEGNYFQLVQVREI
jgi:predicted enzyme related to lactoylglutathione lyase